MVREFRYEAEATQRRDLMNSEENSNDHLKPPTGIFALKPKFTKEELQTIYFMTESHLAWGVGGCFGDGDDITDKKGYEQAKKILIKLKKFLYEAR